MQCPDSSQWKLAAKGICNSSHSWLNCLYDENNMNYTKSCKERPDFQRPGKQVKMVSTHIHLKMLQSLTYSIIKIVVTLVSIRVMPKIE